ncbi:galactokinase [Ruminococcus sp. YE71]|uniref:galactokinase n=1 Tax=unclassified Ruminococcus TaxID=2608920 RepID=UPI0008815104|nr:MULTISPECIES: galactokinase family protein [unclassified Ruminococcus]SDA23519.1 galactokinase [Ruminococcus sp. YE78]SFW39951.1 galactokinase [Ruminococcus sp. YE71]
MIHTLKDIYGQAAVDAQAERYRNAAAEFESMFGKKPERFFSAPGRTEVGGNHTDHNCGCVLAAGVSLDVIAAVTPTDDGIIRIKSQGFPMDTVDPADTDIKDEEENSSAALIRGVAAGMQRRGYKVGGFSAYTTSNVLKGSGLSSSAAFEVLVGTILSGLYNDFKVSPVEIAQIAQFAENIYFGKPSGLMDQMASSVGSFITIDFKDVTAPVIEAIDFDFEASGHKLCIVDTKGSHADLTPDYAAVPSEMKAVAQYFGKNVLREVERADVVAHIPELRERLGDRAVLRAMHFFADSDRVSKEAAALRSHDFRRFLTLINESGDSSYKYLQNIYSSAHPEQQGLSLALNLAEAVLAGEGACRVHGGGFAGTIQAFVPDHKLELFTHRMESVFGKGSCYVLSIRPFGGTEVQL